MSDIDAVERDDAIWNLYSGVGPGDTLQQGDLIKFSKESCPDRYGIVVTADCDLDKKKHSRLVTLVPLLSVEEVICQCLSYDTFENYGSKLQEFCRQSLTIDVAAADSQFLARIKSRLLINDIVDRNVELTARVLVHEHVDITISDMRLILESSGVLWAKVIDRLRNQVKARGDLLVLSSPPLTAASASVAWLRPMWQEQVSSIALRTSESASRVGLRVAQLNSPFRYRLTQMLGQVFADIGLPDIPTASVDAVFTGLNT
ncbi:hypothetical protein [Rhodanobacter glycinis]|uniref:hypothetical protein n=1 Tax=Rhodanobacter glycinis TaxID=582702 RepID=UPI001129FCE7|nr:hypothetical protein [Rhodanobacter glycinis]